MSKQSKSSLDNRANQLNNNNPAYWQSRGFADRPAEVKLAAQEKQLNITLSTNDNSDDFCSEYTPCAEWED